MRVSLVVFLCALSASAAAAQTPDPGRLAYTSRCAGCHGSNGNGGELGPSIVDARAGAHGRGTDDGRPAGAADGGNARVPGL